MSDTSDDPSAPNDKDDTNLTCRDFARGLCDRKFCKYRHENDIRPLNFCHDFQNNVCPRVNCKFIHCTAEEVDQYKTSGEMSNQILAEATRKNQLPGTPPVCNQFKKGLCRRSHCKFRHLTKEQEEQEILELIQNNMQRRQDPVGVTALRRSGVNYDEYQENGPPVVKRRFLTSDLINNRELESRSRVFKGYFAGSPPPGVLNRTLMLEEENQMLLKEIALLNKQVQDLTATNEFLLDQNATLRVSSKQQHGNTVNMPAVTLTSSNNTQPQMIRTVTASVATVPVSLATVTTRNPVSGSPVSIAGCPTVSIASPAQILAPSQQILVTTNPGQQLALATSNQQLTLANAAGQPQQLALASNPQTHQLTNQQLTSQAQQLALANTTQQLTSQAQQLALAATAPQHLTVPAQQLIAAQQNLAASTQQQIELHRTNQITAINTSQAIAMSNATQPMVSYPIMTQQSLNHPLAH
ncbi:zinc finger CCCH domain-containing protein 10-like [Anthonomus grandis grandis]|uniref:zinc finger CCCH domain-containing protein 10-like n=1 Tax=Anthonomus grandis grandis TaxID=2921223 RepID=UPI0021666A92|nr:zinc finger CCCH domain-containing protein 10-like [Anthonomus grandis grandis]